MHKLSSLLAFFLFFSGSLFSQDIAHIIKEGNTDSLRLLIDKGFDINGLYSGYSPLEMAISDNQKKIVNLLFNYHVDLDKVNHGNTPLIYSIYFTQKYDDFEIFNLLIDHGADKNKRGRAGSTPLTFACKNNNYTAATTLFEHGADPSVKDDNGMDFFYYVLRGNDMNLRKYFISRGFKIPGFSSVTDGPYLRWVNDKKVQSNFLEYDSTRDHSEILSGFINVNNNEFKIPAGKYVVNGTFRLNTDNPQPFEYNGVSKIFAIGDLHGNYFHFTQLLKANGVVDDNLNWDWGNGHLVLLGDVFDRGESVTECLWLIYKLESQAEEQGGKVHYILGNHELMILHENNKYYVNKKYIYLCAKNSLDYFDLFGKDYELGKWIRTKNIAVKINDYLFVHGGIPPEFPGMGRTLEKMNDVIHDFINIPLDSIDPFLNNLSIQPAWYRGYLEKRDQTSELDEILNFYNVRHIIVGHTTVRKITELHGGRVVAVNLPFDDSSIIAEALLMQDNACFRVDENGNKTRILIPEP
jgi:hypothetical protein